MGPIWFPDIEPPLSVSWTSQSAWDTRNKASCAAAEGNRSKAKPMRRRLQQWRRGISVPKAGGIGLAVVLAALLVLPCPLLAFSTSRRPTTHRRMHRQPLRQVLYLAPSAKGRSTAYYSFEGKPSSPGWKTGQLDTLTDWAVADAANRAVICEYAPDGLWLWTKWRGTVLKLVILPVLLNMCLCAAIVYYGEMHVEDVLVQDLLEGVHKMWDYQVTLTTFIVTFFTAEAYNHWKAVYFTTRAIQGRINDICLLVTLGAEREDVATLTADCPTKHTTGYSPEAAALVDVCTRLIKLSHTFFWASTPTTSDGIGDGGVEDGDHIVEFPAALRSDDAIAPVLLSRVGLEGLVDAGELTKHEKDALIDSGLPPSQYAYVLLEWVGIHIMDGIRQGRLSGGTGFEENILRQVTALRAEYFSIGDYAAGRMPLAYVQLVQVLVDSLVLLASFGLYTELGRLAVPLTGILTLFYKGLLELSKSFLDPFGVEGYPAQNIRVDVLVSELNFGAASRWVKSGAVLPSYQKADHKSTSCD